MSRESFRPVRGVGLAATVLIGLAAAAEVVAAALGWVAVDPFEADSPAVVVSWISLAVHLIAGITFMIWMSQARLNSDAITSTHQHRYTNMWVFVGWIIPFGNLVIPFVVMQDIWRGSDRSQPMVGLKERPKSGLITAWWISFIGSSLLGLFTTNASPQDAAAVLTLSAAVGVVAAVLAALVIRQTNDRQHAPAPAVS